MVEINAELNANDILIAEFEYARETASQAMDDRHKMVNYFLLIVGLFLNAIVAFLKGEFDQSTLLPPNLSKIVLSGLLFTLFLIGVLYLLKLIRLRLAWYDSAKCMNRIKDYYDTKLSDLELKKTAFRWTSETLQDFKLHKVDTIFCYSAILILFIDSLAFAAIPLIAKPESFWIASGVFIVMMLLQFFYYRNRLIIKEKKS